MSSNNFYKTNSNGFNNGFYNSVKQPNSNCKKLNEDECNSNKNCYTSLINNKECKPCHEHNKEQCEHTCYNLTEDECKENPNCIITPRKNLCKVKPKELPRRRNTQKKSNIKLVPNALYNSYNSQRSPSLSSRQSKLNSNSNSNIQRSPRQSSESTYATINNIQYSQFPPPLPPNRRQSKINSNRRSKRINSNRRSKNVPIYSIVQKKRPPTLPIRGYKVKNTNKPIVSNKITTEEVNIVKTYSEELVKKLLIYLGKDFSMFSKLEHNFMRNIQNNIRAQIHILAKKIQKNWYKEIEIDKIIQQEIDNIKLPKLPKSKSKFKSLLKKIKLPKLPNYKSLLKKIKFPGSKKNNREIEYKGNNREIEYKGNTLVDIIYEALKNLKEKCIYSHPYLPPNVNGQQLLDIITIINDSCADTYLGKSCC
jgi:hypothetical protein